MATVGDRGSATPLVSWHHVLQAPERTNMSLRHEELTPEELALQAGLDRSWAHAQKALADPVFRAHLEESIERVNRSSATPISKEEFLAQTESLIE